MRQNGMAPETQVAANAAGDAPGFGNTTAAPEKKTRYSDRAKIPKEKKAKVPKVDPFAPPPVSAAGGRRPADAVRSAWPGWRYYQHQEAKAHREDPAAGPAQEQAGATDADSVIHIAGYPGNTSAAAAPPASTPPRRTAAVTQRLVWIPARTYPYPALGEFTRRGGVQVF